MPLRFPLLRAPQTVQTEILNLCKPHEVFFLSMCSKRAYNLTKVHRKKSERGQLALMESELSTLQINYYNEKCYGNNLNGMPTNMLMGYRDISKMPKKTEIIKIGNIKVPAKYTPNGLLVTFWEDRVYGIKAVTDYVTRLFNMRIDILEISKSSLWMIDWVNSRQESFSEANIVERNQILTDKEFLHILTNCKATDAMYLSADAPANFQFTGQFQKYNILSIARSPWITLDNLKSMDSIEIFINRSDLTSSNVNLFLKHWLAGGSPRLSYARLEIDEMISNKIFKDLTEKIVRVPEKRKFELLNGDVLYFEKTYDIERADGVKASIKLEIERPYVFFFFVSPATH